MTLDDIIARSRKFVVSEWSLVSNEPFPTPVIEAFSQDNADVYSSEANTINLHRIVLDIDMPAFLVESSTPGHYHLVIDKLLTWADYEVLLRALAEAGVIQQGFLNAALQRKATMLRLPWKKKFAQGGVVMGPRDTQDDSIPAFLSQCYFVTDPDEAEALGLTVEARRMRDREEEGGH